MIRKEFIHLRRNPNVVAFTLGLPVTLVLLFGYALRLKVDQLPLAVWDQEQTFFSTSVTDRLRCGTLRLIEAHSEEQIRARLRMGEARMGSSHRRPSATTPSASKLLSPHAVIFPCSTSFSNAAIVCSMVPSPRY
jgi:hypothetical protein